MRRTQIYLEEYQAEQLSRQAAARGMTASKMIREAIDQYLAGPHDEAERLARYRTALADAFGIAPYLDEGTSYVENLRAADRARQWELDERPRR